MRYRPLSGLLLGMALCLAIAAVSYLWLSAQFDATFAYRSPLHARPPAAGESLGAPVTGRVVFVLIDALREDTSLKADLMPFLAELRRRGAWATMHSRPPSFSQPGYATLMTGAWPDINDGAPLNLDYEEIYTWTQDNLFSLLHWNGIATASFVLNGSVPTWTLPDFASMFVGFLALIQALCIAALGLVLAGLSAAAAALVARRSAL